MTDWVFCQEIVYFGIVTQPRKPEASKQQGAPGCRIRHDDGYFDFNRNIILATAKVTKKDPDYIHDIIPTDISPIKGGILRFPPLAARGERSRTRGIKGGGKMDHFLEIIALIGPLNKKGTPAI